MQLMRYINLFGKITRISTTDCFVYNNTLYFAVPKSLMSQALGKNAENVKTISEVLRKKIRIVAAPMNDNFNKSESGKQKSEILKQFVTNIVAPIEFEDLIFDPTTQAAVISGSRDSKAMLIGRDRVRAKELEEVLTRTFGIKELKFV